MPSSICPFFFVRRPAERREALVFPARCTTSCAWCVCQLRADATRLHHRTSARAFFFPPRLRHALACEFFFFSADPAGGSRTRVWIPGFFFARHRRSADVGGNPSARRAAFALICPRRLARQSVPRACLLRSGTTDDWLFRGRGLGLRRTARLEPASGARAPGVADRAGGCRFFFFGEFFGIAVRLRPLPRDRELAAGVVFLGL